TINSHASGGAAPHADLRFCHRSHALPEVVQRVSTCLDPDRKQEPENSDAAAGADQPRGVSITRVTPVRNETGQVRYFRYGSVVTNWEIKHELPGRLRLKNPLIHRKSDLCQAIERELMNVLGVDSYTTNPLTATVLVQYDPRELIRDQIIEILESALAAADHPPAKDKPDIHLPLCTVSVPVAAVAQFAAPGLLPVAAGLFAYTSIPTFKNAREVIVEERRLGVDVLDAIVVVGCLGTLSIFPGAVLCWCLSFGRVLVKKTQDNSKKLLLNAFGKQPRFVWLYRDGVEVQVSLDRLQAGDTIVVNTGEVVPVDGIIAEGLAMIDQHALTGESTPAEKGVGDRVFASTLLVAGKILVSVEKSGSETASAKISQILSDTAGYKLSSQHKGEVLADKAVIPTLSIGAVGLATMGPAGAVAVLNSDFGTGIRMAAPLAMLSSLALCASKGILVKDGRALELMNEVDTVLFDKTGTLTRERPEVGRVIASVGFNQEEILLYAAAAEKKFHHPIALAILHKAKELNLELPLTDETQYKVGYGITVQVHGRTIRVGSKRFMELEGLPMCQEVRDALASAHDEGHTMVMVGVDDRVGGAIELHAAVRPEVREIVQGLRDRGIKHIAIISGDHEAPTRKLAEALGMDRYFAQVLPADKADYVATLQKEGKKVCFVGDGINDSIALKKANVSISLRGASSIATDTAHIVFMEQGLSKLCDLRDIARELDRNVKRSWTMILVPNIACIAGVFTMGFGIMASVLTNNVSAIGALANGMMPLRQIAEIEAEKQHEQEMRQAYGLARKAV
ncbi:MAG: heavy metal translocating P-type ATPase, partial [Isosphaeraceae bacterium]